MIVVVTVATTELTTSDVARLLKIEEGHFADAKAKDVAPAKLTKSIAAFANADGGELLVGLPENKSTKTFSWDGFARIEDANAHLQVLDALFPLGQDFQYEFLFSPGSSGYVLRVLIQKTREIKTASDGKVYIRRGAQSLPVAEGDAMERLRRNKGISSFETSTVDIPVDFLSESEVLAKFVETAVPQTEPLRSSRSSSLFARASLQLRGCCSTPMSPRQPGSSAEALRDQDLPIQDNGPRGQSGESRIRSAHY